MRDVDRAWLAGFIDGEGHIGLVALRSGKYGGGRYELVVAVFNTHIPTLVSIHEDWPGGRMYTRERDTEKGHRISGTVKWVSRKAANLLQEVYPFLRTKKEQARVALEFVETLNSDDHRSRGLSEETRQRRNELKAQMSLLNGRFPEPRLVAEKVPLTCQRCGVDFSNYTKARKYCSKACSAAAGREFYEQRHIVEKTCPACGNTYKSHSPKQTYCSVRCGLKGNPDVPKGTRKDRNRIVPV